MLNFISGTLSKSLKNNFIDRRLIRKLGRFEPFENIYYETEDFIVKTVSNQEEFLKALNFRHDVFVKEWRGLEFKHGLDIDKFDLEGDHLFIYCKKSSQVIGTYRLICSKFSKKCYSLAEFTLEGFLETKAVRLELGRAAIHPDYRNGTSIDLLWKGLALYIEKTGTEVLFGCSSDMDTSLDSVNKKISFLKKNDVLKFTYNIKPQSRYKHPQYTSFRTDVVSNEKPDLPPLLRSYINAGAKVFGLPAFDKGFSCMDYLTVLEMKNIHPKFKNRYFSSTEAKSGLSVPHQ